MRNFKKFLALVLATLMVISAAATVSAYSDVADDNTYAAAIDALTEYKIVNGTNTELDTFSPDDDVVRYQMALMMARALEPQVTDWQEGLAVFTDVNEWYGAIAYAYTKGIVTGIGNGLFAPKQGIKYQDALIMAVRALGYEFSVTCDPYWIDAYKIANEIGLTNGVKVTEPAKTLTRAETAQVIYNMLKATPADGGATIEEKNFGVAGNTNVTKFVITATPKQAYAAKAQAAEAGYVGIQPLVNGLPDGSIIYIPASVLGIKDEDVENYFNYGVDLVNYVEKTGKFDKAILGADPSIVYSTEVSVSSPKITVNGSVYYPVSEITGAALKNELVIYNGGVNASAQKILLKDSDGDIINPDGTKKAIFAYQSANGTKYYAVVLGDKVISEAQALEQFGVIVEDSYTDYSTLEAAALKDKSFQLSLFDDDGDGKYDRAIYTGVFMSVYPGKADKDKASNIAGPASAEKNVVISGADLAKGDIFVYTYNKALNTVNVIEKLEEKTGVIEKLDLTAYDKYTAKVTIDGTVYTIANSKLATKLGAEFKATTTDKVEYKNIKEKAQLNYVNYDKDGTPDIANIISLFAAVDKSIKFIEFNGYIIAADVNTINKSYDYMTVVTAEDFDNKGVYVDAYLNGTRGTYYITQITDEDTGKEVKFADLSVFRLNTYLTSFASNVDGKVYRVAYDTATKSYEVSKALSDSTYGSLALRKAIDGTYSFSGGVSTAIVSKADRIRTDANTKFYFINSNTKEVALFTGKPADGSKIVVGAKNAKLYIDYVGYGDQDYNKVAKVVFVYYPQVDGVIEGFNFTTSANATVYVYNISTFDVDSAANFGLSGKTGTYFKYTTQALNMETGKMVTIYAKASDATAENGKKPVAGKFYTIDASGVIMDEATVANSVIRKADIDLYDQYITVGGAAVAGNGKATSLITFSMKENKLADTNSLKYMNDAGRTCYYLANGYKDGSVVLVVDDTDKVTPPTPGAKGIANSVFTVGGGNDTYKAISELTATNNGVVSGTVKLYWEAGMVGETITKDAALLESASGDNNGYFSVVGVKYKASEVAAYEEYDAGFEFKGTYDKGVVTIEKAVDSSNHTVDSTFKAGRWEVTFAVKTEKSTVNVTVTFDVK